VQRPRHLMRCWHGTRDALRVKKMQYMQCIKGSGISGRLASYFVEQRTEGGESNAHHGCLRRSTLSEPVRCARSKRWYDPA
jgi:hypothetical protein